MTQSFDELKNFAISDILSVNGKDKTARVIENHMNNLIEVALIVGTQSKKAEIDELLEQVTGQARTAQNQQAEIYRLQSAIEKALERANHAHIGYGMLYAQFDDVIKILESTKLKR